jgi:hypothetical protein
VIGPNRQRGLWPMDGSGFRPIPNLDPSLFVASWSPDGTSLYVSSSPVSGRLTQMYRVNPTTGKVDFWKTIGEGTPSSAMTGFPQFAAESSAYAYIYKLELCEAYVVRGLK